MASFYWLSFWESLREVFLDNLKSKRKELDLLKGRFFYGERGVNLIMGTNNPEVGIAFHARPHNVGMGPTGTWSLYQEIQRPIVDTNGVKPSEPPKWQWRKDVGDISGRGERSDHQVGPNYSRTTVINRVGVDEMNA